MAFTGDLTETLSHEQPLDGSGLGTILANMVVELDEEAEPTA